MSQSDPCTVEHDIEISAPASTAYRLIAEVRNWPQVFPPTIYVDQLEHRDGEERIRIWATANGTAEGWTSRRVLDPENLRIDFRQEVSVAPVAAMGGAWIVEALTPLTCRVRLLHGYRAIDDDPQGLAWIAGAVDRSSRAELGALKVNAELATSTADTTFSFEDTVRINGCVKDVYDFINEANLWPERLPHVATVRLDEDAPGLQMLETQTRAKDGSTHLTRSYRVTFPYRRIVYKQVALPALMSLHTGYWAFAEDGYGMSATSQHTVVLNTANIAEVLGPGGTVARARDYVRDTLSTNSRATLSYAKDYAESFCRL